MPLAEIPLRGPVPIDRDRLEALRARHEVMIAEPALRVSRAWELSAVAQHVIGLSLAGDVPLECGELMRTGSLAAGAAALASSPRASDHVLGRASASITGRTFMLEHERRPVDPMDFFRAFCFAAVVRDAATLAALSRAALDVDPDLAFAGRGGHERSFYRRAFGALCAWARGDLVAAGEQARELSEQAAGLLAAMDDFHRGRATCLVLPLLACCGADQPGVALGAALRFHHAHWSAPQRRADPAGFVAWGPLAAVAIAGAGTGPELATDYLPQPLIDVVQAEPVATVLRYEVPPLSAQTLAEALLRVQLSSAGEIVETGRRQLDGGRTLVELESRDVLFCSYRFDVSSTDSPGIGDGMVCQLDAGELVHLAQRELVRLRASPPGSIAAREALDLGRMCAARALSLLGDDTELFRDRMTSPLGRTMCDEQPHTFTREALGSLVTAFDEATQAAR